MDIKGIYKLLGYLDSRLAKKQTRKERVVATCPLWWNHSGGEDKNPSFAIEIKPLKVSRFHCFSCNGSGTLIELVMEVGTKIRSEDSRFQIKKALQLTAYEMDNVEVDITDYDVIQPKINKVSIWPEMYIDSFHYALSSPTAKKYLLERGVPEWLIKEFGLRFDHKSSRVLIPIRDWQMNLVGLHGRTILPGGQPRYYMYGEKNKNSVVWWGESFVDLSKPVVLVESIFDLMKVYQVYTNVMCSLSSGLSKAKVLRIAGILEAVTLYDFGLGGDAARASLSKYLTGIPLQHLELTKQQDDPGNCSLDELRVCLRGYVSLC